ncbi:MAG: cysteine desulfurase [Bacilli bacterium]|nr:cysteine desulfurase [Bacilli bacterium]
MKIEEQFVMKKKNLIYFDNAATTFKPVKVINKELEYLTEYTANSHRGDYNISFKVDDEIDNTRDLVAKFINAKHKDEIIFTANTTDSLNMVINGFFGYYLNEGDEVILTKSEHASNILPWLMLKFQKGIKIKYAKLNENNELTLETIKKEITKKTKVISIAEVTNVVGDARPIKEITSLAHKHGIYVVIDGAQSVPHKKVDVTETNVDFLAFSAHKMCGPTGVGILYGKKELLSKIVPTKFGGGMNESYDDTNIELVSLPYRLEAGTPNISGIIAFSETIKFLNEIGMENIERTENYLRRYLIRELKKLPYIKIYNEQSTSSTVLINIEGITSGDLGLYLNTKNICVRSGRHCVKMLKEESEFTDTVRISLYFYNTYEEIDELIKALSKLDEIEKFAKN